jgi:YhcH/YjgK/YiaL family protein
MFTCSIWQTHLWQPFVRERVLIESLAWIDKQAVTFAEGIHELGEPGWHVNVHGYTTQPRQDCTWENHPATIDIQFMITGEEAIDVAPVGELGGRVSLDAGTDTEKFSDIGVAHSTVVLRSGDFLVLLPGEAHRPKVAVHEPSALRKLVVKVPARLVGQ